MILPKPLAQTRRCGNRGSMQGSGAREEQPELGESGDAPRVWLIFKDKQAFSGREGMGRHTGGRQERPVQRPGVLSGAGAW